MSGLEKLQTKFFNLKNNFVSTSILQPEPAFQPKEDLSPQEQQKENVVDLPKNEEVKKKKNFEVIFI